MELLHRVNGGFFLVENVDVAERFEPQRHNGTEIKFLADNADIAECSSLEKKFNLRYRVDCCCHVDEGDICLV